MSQLYCTWSHRSSFSNSLRSEFGDLDYFISDLLSKARERLLVVAPYLSMLGMSRLQGPMATAAENGAWIRLVTCELRDSDSWNFKSVQKLVAGPEGMIIRNRLRVLCPATDALTFIHAKLIIADHIRGYLGSANLSGGGLDRNFEVGVALSADQAGALERLVDAFEAQQVIIDTTAELFT